MFGFSENKEKPPLTIRDFFEKINLRPEWLGRSWPCS